MFARLYVRRNIIATGIVVSMKLTFFMLLLLLQVLLEVFFFNYRKKLNPLER